MLSGSAVPCTGFLPVVNLFWCFWNKCEFTGNAVSGEAALSAWGGRDRQTMMADDDQMQIIAVTLLALINLL